MNQPLTGAERSDLRGRAQRIEATIHLGKAGVTEGFVKAMDSELTRRELVKLRFDAFKDQRKRLAPEIAAKTGSELLAIVGHVAVFHRKRAEPGA
ncbi:MAG: YhbY family RNA-binding protein [Verrucomicrobia bacterium]|nr:YhbY family RNA-binding protein [Verrucomicrobiota bacterium]